MMKSRSCIVLCKRWRTNVWSTNLLVRAFSSEGSIHRSRANLHREGWMSIALLFFIFFECNLQRSSKVPAVTKGQTCVPVINGDWNKSESYLLLCLGNRSRHCPWDWDTLVKNIVKIVADERCGMKQLLRRVKSTKPITSILRGSISVQLCIEFDVP